MPIQVQCPGCNRVRSVPAEWAGKTVTCNECHTPHVVPSGSLPTARPLPHGMPPVMPQVPSSAQAARPIPTAPYSAPSSAPRAEDVLAGYSQAQHPATTGLAAKLKGLFGEMGARAKALKVQHDVKNLQAAVVSQLERVGKLVLTHRPPGLNFQRELSELACAQSERGRKQAELNALAQTPGSGEATKQLKKELADLATQERQLMIAIGRSAITARPEMPGGEAQYSALDRLNAALAARHQELAALQAQLAAGGGSGLAGMNWKMPVFVGGAVVGALVIAYLLFFVLLPSLFGGGVPSWAKFYIPENAKAVGYVNIDKLRKNELFDGLDKMMEREAKSGGFDPRDASELFFAGDLDSPLVVIRMREDRSLTSMLPKERRDVKPVTFKNIDYVRSGGDFIAKTEGRIFCVAPREDVLKDAISRFDRREKAKLDKALEASLGEVAGGDFYVAGTNPGAKGMPFQPEAFYAQMWLGSNVEVQATVVFAKSDEAEKAKKVIDAGLVMAHEAPKQIKDLLSGITIKQSGKYLYGQGKWKTKDIKEIAAKPENLPPVQAAREAARRSQCTNNLKQIGLALHNYHDVYKCMPSAVINGNDGKPIRSWRVAILPFIEQAPLFQQYDFKQPWDSPKNRALGDIPLQTYRCPSDPGNPTETNYFMIVGENTLGGKPNERVSFREVPDGLSNTIAVVEITGLNVKWNEPKDITVDELIQLVAGRGGKPTVSQHPGGFNVLIADGSVRFVPYSIDPNTLRALLTRNDGMAVTF